MTESSLLAAQKLTAQKLTALPQTIYYIPNFISESEEDNILQKIASQPKPKWTVLTHRRLQTYPSSLTTSNVLLSTSGLPAWLSDLVPRMQQLCIWDSAPHKAPNHVLVNEYKPGEGIMPHEDGPAYHPMVATISLGASIVLDIIEKGEPGEGQPQLPKWRILQEPRSLLISTDAIYTQYMHAIQPIGVDENLGELTISNWNLLGNKAAFTQGRYDRLTRTSLTYRDVLKVSSIANKIFGGKR